MSLLPFRPLPGPQTAFLSTPATVAVLGGAAGGGKSVSILVEAVRHIIKPGFACAIFRKNRPQLLQPGGLVETARELYSALGGTLNLQTLRWAWPNGASIHFVGLNHDADVYNYQGAQLQLLIIDEATHFGEHAIWYLLGRLRNGTDNGVQPYARFTCNPDPDHMLRKHMGWWIDAQGFPIKERSGVVRWYARQSGVTHWADTQRELTDKGMYPVSFTFVPSLLSDNPILMARDPGYRAQLESLPTHERTALLLGGWDARPVAGGYFSRLKVQYVDALPAGLDLVRGWDFATTLPSETNADPDYTAAVQMAIGADGLTYIADAFQTRVDAAGLESLFATTSASEPEVRQAVPIDPGSAGKSHADALVRGNPGRSITATRVTGSKSVRARPLSAQWQAGNVRLLRGDWNADFIAAMDSFTGDGKAHDDIPDAASEAYSALTSSVPARVRTL